jgi:hypothetical protein
LVRDFDHPEQNACVDDCNTFLYTQRSRNGHLPGFQNFQPFTHAAEEVSSYLIKMVDSTHNAKTIFFLYNPFHYKEFISRLTKSKYEFKGTRIIDNKSYTVFKNKRTVFLTTEKQDANNHSFFEIIVQT